MNTKSKTSSIRLRREVLKKLTPEHAARVVGGASGAGDLYRPSVVPTHCSATW
jgi:hypothetical protein